MTALTADAADAEAEWPPPDFIVNRALGRDAGRPGALSPVRLPAARDQTSRRLRLDTDLRPGLHGMSLGEIGRGLAAAELFWVTADMAALAVGAGADLSSVDWQVERPAGFGLMLFVGGVGTVTVTPPPPAVQVTEVFPVDAISWQPSPAGMQVNLFTGRWRLHSDVEEMERVPPPLVLVGGIVMSPGVRHVADWDTEYRTLITTLSAAWVLMSQPTLAERIQQPLGRKQARSYARAGRPVDPVQIVDLRTLYRQPHEHDEDGPGRTYRHRWVVRGHWRNQAVGHGRAQHKRIFVPSYTKGPDGAPLLERQRVNVWRR